MRRASEGIQDGEKVALVMRVLAERTGVKEWSCDGGTALAAAAAEKMGIMVDQVVGHYWHQSAETLVAIRGGTVEEYAGVPLDEHHHWLLGDGWLYDGNGALREEPNLQATSEEVFTRYEEDEALDFDEYLDTMPADWIEEMCTQPEKDALGMIDTVVNELGLGWERRGVSLA
jgi:hypothetical protein